MRFHTHAVLLIILLLPGIARAEIPENKIKLGFLDDASALYEHRTPRSAEVAMEMAIEDFGARHAYLDVESHKDNTARPDNEPGMVRDWLDKEHIDAVIDVAASAAALPISDMLRQHNRIFVVVNLVGLGFSGSHCSPTTLRWGASPAALSSSLVSVLHQDGARRWFFISADQPLDQAVERTARAAITGLGGEVVGSINPPLGTGDFSHDLMQAMSQKPDVVAIGETGKDLQTLLRQAMRSGVASGPKMAGLYVQQQDVAGMLRDAQGLYLATPFYANRNDASRDFARRFTHRMVAAGPTEIDAEVYSATLALLNAMDAVRSVDGDKIMSALRKAAIPDPLLGTVTVRADGVAAHSIYVVRVKRPDQSLKPNDDYEPVSTVAAAQAFTGPGQPGCPAGPSR
ncbi:ABC transporter substrate-binding protein [Rhodopila sp.]|uniref:ABC transporter substrate-binding protein n=1 Tax=Rhodopila sp. TaxID=2480087 RepID=UPI003D09AFB4